MQLTVDDVPGLGDNILGLSRLRQGRAQMLATLGANLSEPLRLKLVAPSGTNPGELRMLTYIPPGLPQGAPLVVALHGCTQNAAAYDHGAGWSTLAERHGFAVLLPEQQRANNSNLCFNWFQDDDITRGRGEVESIAQMVRQTVAANRLDPSRVYVTGLSAGGAITSALLATYPELFAAGAIIAGLPYRAANGMMEAFGAMGQPRTHTPAQWGSLIRAASTHRGPRPAVQIWQGTADTTVNPANAAALVAQWSDALGLPAQPPRAEQLDGARHDIWPQLAGRTMLEQFIVPGLGHGTPIRPDAPDADQAAGHPGPHMLASTISSTWHIARGWGLLTQAAQPRLTPTIIAKAASVLTKPASIIERSLKAAGILPS